MANSPFNRSGMTSRSPPPQPPPPQPPITEIDMEEPEPKPDTLICSTADIKGWMEFIEKCLSEVCAVATEGKLNSDQKLRINSLCRKIGSGSSQMAVFYQSIKQKYICAQMSIQTLNERQDLAHCLEELKSAVKDSKPAAVANSSYASATKKGIVCPTKLSSVAIFPTDKQKTSEETRTLVQKIINPEELKLQVRAVRKTKNGGVIISTENEEDIKKLKTSEKLTTSGLTVADPDKRKPKMIIFGLPKDHAEKEFFDLLYDQNIAPKLPGMSRDQFLSSTRLSHKSGKKEAQTSNFIIEVPADVRKALINQGRVFLNWSSFPVKDFTHVSRCFKCQQYGHSAKFCRDTEHTCGHCGQLGHLMKDCTKKEAAPVCATCLRYKKPSNHKTGDDHCPARKHAVSRYIESTNYEGA